MAGPISYLIHSTHTWEALDISTYTCMNNNNNKEGKRRFEEHVVASRMDHLVNSFMNANYKSNADDSFFDNQNGAPNANISTQHVGSFKALLELGMPPGHVKNEGALGEFSKNQNGNFQECFKCTVCNKDMGTSAKLARHMKTHAEAKAGKEYVCSICGNMYAHRYNLKRHLKRAHKMTAEEIPPALLSQKSQGSTDGFDHVSPLNLDKDDKSELFATYVGENGMFDDKTNILETNFNANTFTAEFASGSYSNLNPNSTFGNEFSIPHPATKKTQPSDINILNGPNEIPPFAFTSLVPSFKSNTSCSKNSTSSSNTRNDSTNSLASNSSINNLDTNHMNSSISKNTGSNHSIFNINNNQINSGNTTTTNNSNCNNNITTTTNSNMNNSNKNTITTIHNNNTAISHNINTNTSKINSGNATANSNSNSSNSVIHKLASRVANVAKNEEKPKCHVCDKELSTKWSLMRHLAKVHKLDPKPNESTPPSLMKDAGNAEMKHNPDNPLSTVKTEPGYQPLDTKTQFLDTKADTKFLSKSSIAINGQIRHSDRIMGDLLKMERAASFANFSTNPGILSQRTRIDLNAFSGFPGLTREEYNYLTTGLGSAQELLLNSGHGTGNIPLDQKTIGYPSLLSNTLPCIYNQRTSNETRSTEMSHDLYNCQICGAKLKSEHDFKTHMEQHNVGTIKKCSLCTSEFPDEASFQEHMKIIHKPDSAISGGILLGLSSELESGSTKSTVPPSLKVSQNIQGTSKYSSSTSQVYSPHLLQRVVSSVTSSMQLFLSNKVDAASIQTLSKTRTISGLITSTHTSKCSVKEEPNCEDGSEEKIFFDLSQSVISGNKNHTEGKATEVKVEEDKLGYSIMTYSDKLMYKCNMCNKELASKSGLNVHMKRHTGENLHRCNACGKSFTHKCRLITHLMNAHTSENRSGVTNNELNGAGFLSGDTTDEVPKCAVCGKEFPNKTSLRQHVDCFIRH